MDTRLASLERERSDLIDVLKEISNQYESGAESGVTLAMVGWQQSVRLANVFAEITDYFKRQTEKKG